VSGSEFVGTDPGNEQLLEILPLMYVAMVCPSYEIAMCVHVFAGIVPASVLHCWRTPFGFVMWCTNPVLLTYMAYASSLLLQHVLPFINTPCQLSMLLRGRFTHDSAVYPRAEGLRYEECGTKAPPYGAPSCEPNEPVSADEGCPPCNGPDVVLALPTSAPLRVEDSPGFDVELTRAVIEAQSRFAPPLPRPVTTRLPRAAAAIRDETPVRRVVHGDHVAPSHSLDCTVPLRSLKMNVRSL
jgi:hypothetical protein